MNHSTLNEIRNLINHVMYAPTKKDAQHPLSILEFKQSNLEGIISSYLYEKLGEVISFAKEASGKSKDKEHWISCVEKNWSIFETGIQQDS